MAGFLNTVNKLAKNLADQLEEPKPGDPNNESPSKGTKLSLEKAPREDLIEFIKKQAAHTKKVESRLTDLLEAYKKVAKEKTDLKDEFDHLKNKYKLLCGTKVDEPEETQNEPTSETEQTEGEQQAPHQVDLEKLVARLEREREDLQKRLAEVQELARTQAQTAATELEDHKTQIKQLNEKLSEKAQGGLDVEEKLKMLNEKFSEEQERALNKDKEKEELKTHLEHANLLVTTLQKECDDAKDTFNTLKLKAEEDKAMETRRMEAIQEELQSNFQVERDLLKGELQKLMQEVSGNAEKYKQEREKVEEDMLNVELERRMLEEKLAEIKGDGQAVFTKDWEEEKQKLQEELTQEQDRVKKLAEELAWERERKDAFDKRLEGIENRGESERNRTLEAEKRQQELRIKELEQILEEKEHQAQSLQQEASENEQHQTTNDSEKERLELQFTEQASKFNEELESLTSRLSQQTQLIEDAKKSKEEMLATALQLEISMQALESEKVELEEKLRLAAQEHQGLEEKLRQAAQEHQDNEHIQEYLEKMGEEKNELLKEVERLRKVLEDTKAEGNETNSKLGSITHQLNQSHQELAAERKALTESVTLHASELTQQKETQSKLASELDALHAQLKEAEQKVEALEKEKTEKEIQLEKAKQVHEEEKSEMVRSSSSKSLDGEAKIAELETERSKLKATIVELETEIGLMTKEADKVKIENARMLADKIKEISVLEEKLSSQGSEVKHSNDKEPTNGGVVEGKEDEGKLRIELSEKEAEVFQLKQEIYEKDKNILEGKALLEQSNLMQAQLREDIAERDEQITHLKEEQEIQLRSVSAPVAAAAASESELAEKLHKYRQLLVHAQNHINDLKRKLSDKQNDVFEYQKKVVSLNEEIEKLKSDQTKYSEKNFTQLQKNYEQHCRTSKHRIDSLEQQLQTSSKDLNSLRNEYQSYKVRAASALKSTPAPAASTTTSIFPQISLTRSSDQEHLVRSLAQEIDSLKAGRMELEETKMHVYKLEADNAQLSKQVKQYSDQLGEWEAKLKAETVRLTDEKQELSLRLNAQKDDIQQQYNLLDHNHKSIIKEKDERISVLEYQAKLLQEESNMKANTIQKLQLQVSELKTSPTTPRYGDVAPSPRFVDLRNYYSDEPSVAGGDHRFPDPNDSLSRSTSTSSFGSVADDSLGSSKPHSAPIGDPILYYAQLQALREEELAKSHVKIKEMQNQLGEAEKMEKLHTMQEQALKHEIRELQRAQKREGTNPEYLKNVIVKYIEFEDQQEKLLPVISTLLQLTPVEVKRLEDKRKARYSLLGKVWGK